jgi:hypothetical protein
MEDIMKLLGQGQDLQDIIRQKFLGMHHIMGHL